MNKNTTPPTLFSSEINCPHFLKCSGCEISKEVDTPPVLKEAREYFAKKGIHNFDLILGPSTQWRFRAKLAVRGTIDNPIIGLYQKNSHVALDIPHCQVHHPKINEAVLLIKNFIKKEKIEPYNEETGSGLLRYIQLVVERSCGKVQLTFVINKNSETDLEKWKTIESDIWHSIWLNFNTSKTNNIFGSLWTHISGAPLIYEQLSGTDVYFHPASFAQANLNLFEKLLISIKEKTPENARVVEYYAGVGIIGLKIASKCKSVVCCETTEQAEMCFNFAKEKLPAGVSEKISFQTGFSEKRLDLLENKDVVIVDPPRKGLDKKLLEQVLENHTVKQLFYISCGFKAFQRDCDRILDNSDWTLEDVEAYLFFPGSNHIEIFARFTKSPHTSFNK